MTQLLLVHDITSRAFAYETAFCDAFDHRFPRSAATIKAKARLIAAVTIGAADINSCAVVVLTAIAQEAQMSSRGSRRGIKILEQPPSK